MNAPLKNALLIIALFAVVVAGSVFYSRSIRQNETPIEAPAIAGPESPAFVDGPPLSPEMTAAMEAIQEERFEDALASLERVPATDPRYLVALDHLGSVRMRLGDWEGARAALEELIERQVDTAGTLGNLAWIEFRLGAFDSAELAALRALEILPEDPRFRYDTALFRVAQERLLEAIDTYERAIERHGDREHVMRAVDGLATLHELHPENAAAHYALAYFAHRLQRDELELEELRHYLATEPSGPTADYARQRLEEIGGTPG